MSSVQQGVKKPLQKLIDVSTRDAQKAAPISFVRQVLAACLYPKLLKTNCLPLDVRQRTQRILGDCEGGSVGSYSPAKGMTLVCQSIAEFIMRQDSGSSSHPENIIISGGSQSCLMLVLHLMASGEGGSQTGVLTPIPCSDTLPLALNSSGVTAVPYQLTEDRGWALDLDELHRALRNARGLCKPRAIYISNPGIPTGLVIQFAAAEGLILLAEEVYQDSVYGQDKEFISYRKVLQEMEKKYSETVELISFNSLSNAYTGECGLRGGYMEAINLDPAVFEYLREIQCSKSLHTICQLALEAMANPPSPGDPSYETYTQEILRTRTTLSQNAQRACEFLNNLPGMKCQPAMAGIFLYPRLQLPPWIREEAKVLGVKADLLYCQKLLEEEGVCLGAGCQNGQDDPDYHIRLCVLTAPATLDEVLAHLSSFHLRLLDRFPLTEISRTLTSGKNSKP